MATKADSYNSCPKCKGIGVAQTQKGEENPCQMCNGLGGVENGFVDVAIIIDKCNDIMDRCNDILDKCNDIFEKVNI